MARKARGASLYGVYHIQQSSSGLRPLFQTDEARMKFLDLLKAVKHKYGIKLYAYCLEDFNSYHLLIHANGSDLTQMMKSLNIAYAMYVKCENPLFKDRYRSIRINDKAEFDKVIENIKCSKVQGSCFNSDSEICDAGDPFQITCKTCIKTLDEAYDKLSEISLIRNVEVSKLLEDKEKRNDLIHEFRRNSSLSLKELGLVFGGLSESSVSKILKSSL